MKSSKKKIQKKTRFAAPGTSKNWDVKLSVKENMKNEGLYTNINEKINEVCHVLQNKMPGKTEKTVELPDQPIEVEEMDIKDLQKLIQQSQNKLSAQGELGPS